MKKNKAKIKVYSKDGVLNIKFMIHNIMLTEKEAKRKKLTQDYITHIILRVGKRILFDFTPSGYVSDSPLFKIKVKQGELKEDDLMELEWTTLLGYKGHYSKKIKNHVKP